MTPQKHDLHPKACSLRSFAASYVYHIRYLEGEYIPEPWCEHNVPTNLCCDFAWQMQTRALQIRLAAPRDATGHEQGKDTCGLTTATTRLHHPTSVGDRYATFICSMQAADAGYHNNRRLGLSREQDVPLSYTYVAAIEIRCARIINSCCCPRSRSLNLYLTTRCRQAPSRSTPWGGRTPT